MQIEKCEIEFTTILLNLLALDIQKTRMAAKCQDYFTNLLINESALKVPVRWDEPDLTKTV